MTRRRGDDPLVLTAAARHLLAEQRRAFFKKFGRYPGPEDPIFFDPQSDVPKPYLEDQGKEAWDAIVKVASGIGLRQAIVHAMKVTGRIVTDHNRHLLSEEELFEWEAAVASYEEPKR